MLYPNCAPAWEYVAIPLGSSSAAPVMRPGPNCFTRGFSVMLLSSLTIAVLQKRTLSPTLRRGRWRSEDQNRREPDRSGHLRLPHSAGRRFGGPKALSTPMRGCRSRGTHYHSYIYSRGRPVQRITGGTIDRRRGGVKEKITGRQTRPSAETRFRRCLLSQNRRGLRRAALAYGCSLGLCHLGDDVVRDLSRHGFVVRELHGVGGAAARHSAQLSDVAEHLRQRHVRDDGDVGAALQLIQDRAAAAIDVADHIAQVVAGRHRLDLHDRLEENRSGLANGLAEAGLGGDFEGERVGIDVVETAVDQRRAEIHRRIVGEHPVFFLNLQALLDRRHELPGY